MKAKLIFKFFVLLSFVFCAGVCFAADNLEVKTNSNLVKKLNFKSLTDNKLTVSVFDESGSPIRGLKEQDFNVYKNGVKANIVSVEATETKESGPLNIVLVLDNSTSMKRRDAVKPLLSALDEFLKIIGPNDNVSVVVFDPRKQIDVGGKKLSVKIFKSNKIEELKAFFNMAYDSGMTSETVLYEAMVAGLDLIKKLPQEDEKVMVIFSDGEDINSSFKDATVTAEANGIPKFKTYCIDYMPSESMDLFLEKFSKGNHGKTWKAKSSKEFLEIFKSLSSMVLCKYIVTYRFMDAPKGNLIMEPKVINVEELTVTDVSPLLNYVFFDNGSSIISKRYHLFKDKSETQNFSENNLTATLEKYYDVLNIIGKRLIDNPTANIKIVGCTSNFGLEKAKKGISQARAENIKKYFENIWGIEPSRISLEARGLPVMPSANTSADGRAENQRVEILSNTPAILENVRSSYTEAMPSTKEIRLLPNIKSANLAKWKITLYSDDSSVLKVLDGKGKLNPVYTVPLNQIGFKKLGACKQITAVLEASDKIGQSYKDTAVSPVKFVEKKEQLSTKKVGQKTVERYALILFDFNKSDVKERNKVVVNEIGQRLSSVSDKANTSIVGHTDIIGGAKYNLTLSQKRASVVNSQLVSKVKKSQKISHKGVGASEPLYDNSLPEGRALNRTVTVSIDYESQN